MSNTTIPEGSVIAPLPSTKYMISFHWSGKDNGVPKEGFDTRCVDIPDTVKIKDSQTLKDVAEAMAQSMFQEGKKYVGLTLAIINIVKLPL